MGLTLTDAMRLLGVTHPLFEDHIVAAYRAAVRDAHPDTRTQQGAQDDGPTIAELQAARDLVLARLNQGQEITCKLCGGSGRVQAGFGAACAACNGTGQQR
jgi:DnaJ-class molecular chaperone